MSMAENFRALLMKLMNAFSDLFEGRNLKLDFDLLPGIDIAAYVLLALGLFAIARRRKLHNAWLAWVPVANLWLLGCISDQYRYVTRSQERNRRTLLLVLGIVEAVAKTVLFVTVLRGLGSFLLNLNSFADLFRGGWRMLEYAGWWALVSAFGSVVLLCKCFALHDLYHSCVPQKKTLFTVLSVLSYLSGISLVPALLVFLSRDQEAGMPPRIEA